ncbi:terminase large subunit [Thermoactinomyces sp. DSM 45892]|uniref:terminase large subunit n=1 Tax=Thermoactinomyces sp. DSM 45892 TaxID=1882753 RepID=UPI00089D5ACC|nr:terminase TerL endonuclease subunit [Thermoactinomyces sp. DSM 45892]SDY69240.1 Phage terminase-like protein, large subunit, contains N-terminal HTH domain [Thermoactinomyces sp. DSM 45892]
MPVRGLEYAESIVSRELLSCELEYLACKRFLDDLDRQGTEDFPYVFDPTRAQRIVSFFENYCRHVKGSFAGQTIELLPFQVFDLINIFAWVDQDGARRFTRAFIEEARGNAKSAIMSGVALYGMTADCIYPPNDPDKAIYEENPSVVCAAYDREQAKIVWKDACTMAQGSPEITKNLTVKRTYVEHKRRGGHLKTLSKDTRNKDGMSVTVAIADEIHAWRSSEVMDVILSGFGKRSQNLFCAITTAGVDAENSIGKKEHDICEKILKGEIPNENYFAVIRQLDQGDDPHNSNLWVKANPMLRYDNKYIQTLKRAIQQDYDIAYGSGDPAKIREFLVKRCCLWQSDSENKYFSGLMDKWKSLAIPRNEFRELVKGKPCYSGLDLSKTTDLTAVGFVFPLDDGRFAVTAHGFIPSESASKHERTDRVPYKHWANEKWCTLTDGYVVDYGFIKRHIKKKEQREGWSIKEICYDPYNATHFTQDLDNEGYTCVEVRQGAATLSLPTKRFRELVLQNKIVHDGSPLLTWCLSNAYEVTDNNANIKLSKKHKDDSQRIDLLAAIINAMTRGLLMNADKESIYNERGFYTI